MSIAKVGDINLYYEVHGKGEPLVLIMGYRASNVGWFLIQDNWPGNIASYYLITGGPARVVNPRYHTRSR